LRAIDEKITSRGGTKILAFLDLKAAFDRVPKSRNLEHIRKTGHK